MDDSKYREWFRDAQARGVVQWKAPQDGDDPCASPADIASESITPIGWIVLAGCALLIVLSLLAG